MNWRWRLRRRRAVALATSACVLAVAVPTAVAATWEDLRSPDARDAALAAEKASQSAPDQEIHVNPSTGFASGTGTAQQDLRSPDTRDAARGITTGSVSAPEPAPVERRTVIAVEEHGSQTLAIVLAASALMIALLAAGFVAVARRPRPRWTAP